MPQLGFHALIGLVVAKAAAARWAGNRAAPEARPGTTVEPLVAGVVFGSMLPDLDMYPAAIAVLVGRSDLVYVIHRAPTHSLLALLLVLLAGTLFRVRHPAIGALLTGLSLGLAVHFFLDMFFWFAPIDLFWPASHLRGGMPVVDLWTHFPKIPTLWVNIREALEFAAFGLFLHALRSIGRRGRALTGLRNWEIVSWVYFGITLCTAFVFRDVERVQNLVVTTPYLLVMVPLCWREVWLSRIDLAAWAAENRSCATP